MYIHVCIILFVDFCFEYLSILAGAIVFAVVSVKAQMKKEVNFLFVFIFFYLVFSGGIIQ